MFDLEQMYLAKGTCDISWPHGLNESQNKGDLDQEFSN